MTSDEKAEAIWKECERVAESNSAARRMLYERLRAEFEREAAALAAKSEPAQASSGESGETPDPERRESGERQPAPIAGTTKIGGSDGSADREQIIGKLRELICKLSEYETEIIISALRLADAAERQAPVAWMVKNEYAQSIYLFMSLKEAEWRLQKDSGTLIPLYPKLPGAADEKAG